MRVKLSQIVWVLLFHGAILSAQTVTETTLYNFPNFAGEFNYAQLIQAQDGYFYGLTPDSGIFFKISAAGTYTKLDVIPTEDGSIFFTGLVQGPDGNFYAGEYNECFAPHCGSILKLTPAGTVTQLYQFTGGSDGAEPVGGLILGEDGYFYGTASQGGNSSCSAANGGIGCGTIYKISPSGVFSVIYTFNGDTDGGLPESALLQGSDGNFYGTTSQGGSISGCTPSDTFGCGTIFQFTPGYALTTLYDFTVGTDNEFVPSYSALVEGSDGNYYGTTEQGGASGFGIVYQITPTGIFNSIYQPPAGSPDVVYALQGLFPAGINLFYGAIQDGEVFSITNAGKYTGLYNFPQSDSGRLLSGVTPGDDGNLFGTYAVYNFGSIYKLNFDPLLPSPVQLSLSSESVEPDTAVVASWQVLNAFSLTMQQCYGFENLNGTTTPLGKQSGTYNSTTKLYSGSRTFTPTLVGTYNYGLTCGGVESSVATLNVGASSTTAPSASPNSPSVGQYVTLNAIVAGAEGLPSGSVTFYYGSDVLHTSRLSSGIASFIASTEGLAPGNYNITAKYSGDSTYYPTHGGTSVQLAAAPTSTSVLAAPTSVTPPGSVTLTATVQRSANGATGTPTGNVTFYGNGSVALATAELNSNGIASVSASSKGYPAGTYPVTATYLGDASDSSSTSTDVDVTVK